MIVNRQSIHVRPGRMQDAVKLAAKEIAAERERSGYTGRARICTSSIGQFDQMAIEWEYENLAEYEMFWADWSARPTTPEFMKKWLELTKGGGTNEIWDLVE